MSPLIYVAPECSLVIQGVVHLLSTLTQQEKTEEGRLNSNKDCDQ